MATMRMTIVLEVPETSATRVSRAVDGLMTRVGGEVVSTKAYVFSPAFEALGLSAPLNTTLVEEGIQSVPELRGHTEAQLLAKDGINYATLRQIIRRLAGQRKKLKGCRVRLADLIEHLDITTSNYERLKRAGYHAISQVAQLDGLELEQLIGPAVGTVQELARYGHSLAPLKPDHPLRALLPQLPRNEELIEAGINLNDPIGQLTTSGLRVKLEHYSGFSDPVQTANWITYIGKTLAGYGYQLPD